MGKFDDYLICSDVDGTFTGGERTQENIEAVRYFTENGGRFTFATGRLAQHLEDKGLLQLINCPACLCNGSILYDRDTRQILRQVRVPFCVGAFLDAIRDLIPSISKLHLMPGGLAPVEDYLLSEPLSPEILDSRPVKILCRFDAPEKADAFRDAVADRPLFRNTCITKSWSLGVEFNHETGTKGHALDFLKRHLPGIHTTIGIGDYENDFSLLDHADLAVAVANAIEPLKQQADIIVASNKDAAIRDLVSKLEARLDLISSEKESST